MRLVNLMKPEPYSLNWIFYTTESLMTERNIKAITYSDIKGIYEERQK